VPAPACELRREFLLDPTVTFLNHGSFGACPHAVLNRCQALQRELERGPVDFVTRRLPTLLDEARARLADYVGAAAADLAFVANATTGVNLAARSLDLQPGDEVLATDLEYGACDLAWNWACRRAGARYLRAGIPLPASGPHEIVETLFARVGERTRAVFVSHVTSETALVLPVAEIAARAHAAGLVTIVDGAHAPAHVPVDLESLGADFYAGNCHKWLNGVRPSGFLYVRPEWQERVDGAIVSWGYEEPSTFTSRVERQGTRDPGPLLSVPAAIEFTRAHDAPERSIAVAREARRELCELFGTEPIAPEEMVLRMASVRLPTPHPELSQRLFDEHGVEVLVSRDGTLLRISIAMYNDRDDVDRLLSVLARGLD
jgi:isopenicillin-N epimerase